MRPLAYEQALAAGEAAWQPVLLPRLTMGRCSAPSRPARGRRPEDAPAHVSRGHRRALPTASRLRPAAGSGGCPISWLSTGLRGTDAA